MDIRETATIDAHTHWYYVAKFKALQALIPFHRLKTVVDIGSGQQIFAKLILEHTAVEQVYCIDTKYAGTTHHTIHGKPLHACQHMPMGIHYDCVLLMDVLEHIELDRKFLSDCIQHAPSNTLFFISVPAFQWLFSSHDRYLKHYRRYTIQSLHERFQNESVHVESLFYFFNMVFPMVVLVRMFKKFRLALVPHQPITSDMAPASGVMNTILLWLCRIDLLLLGKNRWFGVSAMAVLRTH